MCLIRFSRRVIVKEMFVELVVVLNCLLLLVLCFRSVIRKKGIVLFFIYFVKEVFFDCKVGLFYYFFISLFVFM